MTWRAKAACQGMEALFFPRSERQASRALAICESCPVTVKCGEYADAKGMDSGVWGGRLRGVEFGFPARGRRGGSGRGGKRPGAGRPHIIDLDELAGLSDLSVDVLAEVFGVQTRTVYRRLRDLAEVEARGSVSASAKESA